MRVKGRGEHRGLGRAFDGWQLGLILVVAAIVMVLLLVPRPATPLELPEPHVSPRELALLEDEESRRAASARLGLPDVVKSVGSAIRALGRAEASRDARAQGAAREDVAASIGAVPRDLLPTLLSLRALQCASFVTAVRAWERGRDSADREELGGGLVPAFEEAGYTTTVGGRPRVAMDDDELAAAFRKRWNGITGLKGLAGASLVDEKLLFTFAIRHHRSRRPSLDPTASKALGARALTRRIDEYARLDASYPADFARGVALFGAGSFAAAQVAFQRHVEARPDGPLALRAHNFGRAALAADVDGVVP